MAVNQRIPTRAGRFHAADVASQPVTRNTGDDKAYQTPTEYQTLGDFDYGRDYHPEHCDRLEYRRHSLVARRPGPMAIRQ